MEPDSFPHGQIHAIAYDLLMADSPATVDEWTATEVLLRGTDGRSWMWILQAPLPADYAERLRARVKALPQQVLEILLVGGEAGEAEKLREGVPLLARGFVSAFHLPATGELWSHRKPRTTLGKYLAAGGRGNPAPDYTAMQSRVGAKAEAVMNEWRAFTALTERNRVVATWVLAAGIIAMFALQVAFGATKATPMLARMGALHRDWVLDGQIHRMITCGFLHGGVPHLLFNLMALLIFAPQLERILGSGRFLVLYTGALIGGSLASMAGQSHVSVGASGALWGLMAAQFVLAWRSKGVLPSSVQRALFSGAAQNLALNLINSFRPGVDWAAHLGGGLAGAAILLVFVPSLPTLSAPTGDAPKPSHGWLRPLALGAGVTLVVGAVLGPVLGRPWSLRYAPELRTVALPTGDRRIVDVPAGLPVDTDPNKRDKTELVLGDFLRDGMALGIRSQFAYWRANDSAEYIERVEASLRKDGIPGIAGAATVTRLRLGNRDAVRAESTLPNGVRATRIIAVSADAIDRVEYVRLGDLPAAWQGLADTVLASIRAQPEP